MARFSSPLNVVAAALDRGGDRRRRAEFIPDVAAERADRDFLVRVVVLVEAGARRRPRCDRRRRRRRCAWFCTPKHFVARLLALVAAAVEPCIRTPGASDSAAPRRWRSAWRSASALQIGADPSGRHIDNRRERR